MGGADVFIRKEESNCRIIVVHKKKEEEPLLVIPFFKSFDVSEISIKTIRNNDDHYSDKKSGPESITSLGLFFPIRQEG